MKVYLFYRQPSEADLEVEVFLKTLEERLRERLTLVDADTRDGDALGRLYSVMAYPSVAVVTSEGVQIKLWHGELPTIEEISAHLESVNPDVN